MSTFNDRIREQMHRQRLMALRMRLLEGPFPVLREEFEVVFTKTDFAMIDRMLGDYLYSEHKLPKAPDLAPHLKPFVISSAHAAHKLNALHKKVRDLADWKLDHVALRMRKRQIRDEFSVVTRQIVEIKMDLAAIAKHDLLRYIRRPVELPEKPLDATMSKYWVFTSHELSRRYPWYYWWGDRYRANLLPNPYTAEQFLLLWQVESHLGMKTRTHEDVFDVDIPGWNWKPVCIIGP